MGMGRLSIASLAMAAALVLAQALPAQAQRTSLSDLQNQINTLQGQVSTQQNQLQMLQNFINTYIGNPCPFGQAQSGINADGTPICISVAVPTVIFSHDFTQGTAGIADAVGTACPAWQQFITDAGAHGSLTVGGSAGADRTCDDPAKVDQIVQALKAAAAGPTTGGNSAVIQCNGFNWSISNFCASTANGAPGAPQAELKVSPVGNPVPGACACQTAGESVYAVRPCIGNQNWGGVGTDVCNAPNQTITVTLQ